ncbi:galactose-1-phosphate uridylyltransferase [Tsukamurella serpentis]
MTREIADPAAARLADGRRILFFNADEPPSITADQRGLPQRPQVSQTTVRRDPTTGDAVIIAPARQERTYKPPRSMCPLCPDPTGRSSEIPARDYEVAVFENRFPSLSGPPGVPWQPSGDDPLRAQGPGIGRCEVVCFTSEHEGSFARLSPNRARLVVDAWTHRTAEMFARSDIEEVYCFENRGEEIGVTLPHPHGQIYGYPLRTRRTAALVRTAQAYRAEHDADLFEAVLAAEIAEGTRILIRTEYTTAFVPYAAKWPVEVHVYPNRHHQNLTELTDAEADDLAAVYLRLLRGFDALYDAPLPYIAGWHQYRSGSAEGYLHAELFSIRRSSDKLKYLAGSESGRDAFITDKTPEAIAAQLREVIR